MKKQTAVEWLQEAMSNKLSKEIGPSFLDLFEQAKEMEKDQIMTTAAHCHFEGGNYKMSGLELFEYGFKYYTSTYGS
jgi:hypothetical protein